MKNNKTFHENGDENILWDDIDWLPKEKRHRRIRRERNRRDKFGFDKHSRESFFR